jgi:hypothetical protein
MSILIYTLLRLFILIAFLGAGYLIGFRGILLLVVAFLASGIVSLFVLSKTRDEFSNFVANKLTALNKKIDSAGEKEDKIINEN